MTDQTLPNPGPDNGWRWIEGEPQYIESLDRTKAAVFDNKGFSEEKCVRCGWVMGNPALNCNNDNTPHVFPSQQAVKQSSVALTGHAFEPYGGNYEDRCRVCKKPEPAHYARATVKREMK